MFRVADVHAIDQHAAGVDVVEAADQINQCRLTAAATTDDADLLARSDREIHLLEDGAMSVVSKRNVLKADLATSKW